MRHVIVGNGVAGVTAAAELAGRQAGQIAIYSEEPHHYYFRPRLPHFVGGQLSRADLEARQPAWYEERGIAVHLASRVASIQLEQKQIVLQSGEEIGYDRLLLATGGVPFVPPIDGVARDGVFCLRSLDDAMAIKDYAADCREAVVIGGGLLGLESAKGLKEAGLSVTVLESAPHLCPRQLDEEGGEVFQHLIEDLGIEVSLYAHVEAILGEPRVERVVLHGGNEIAAQIVVIAAGIRSNVHLAKEAGLQVEQGIVVDERMATSEPDIYAAGDAASFQGRLWGIVPIARAQAQVAAANMAGEEVLYDEPPPATTLKIVGIGLTSVGAAAANGEGLTNIRRSGPGFYTKLVMDKNKLVGAIIIGDRSLARKLTGLVVDGARLNPEQVDNLVGSV